MFGSPNIRWKVFFASVQCNYVPTACTQSALRHSGNAQEKKSDFAFYLLIWEHRDGRGSRLISFCIVKRSWCISSPSTHSVLMILFYTKLIVSRYMLPVNKMTQTLVVCLIRSTSGSVTTTSKDLKPCVRQTKPRLCWQSLQCAVVH